MIFKSGDFSFFPSQIISIHRLRELNGIHKGVALWQTFERHTMYLCHLYKECYADVSMIMMLDSSFENYYSCIFEDEEANCAFELSQGGLTLANQIQERHTDRLALVILAMESYKRDWGLAAAKSNGLWAIEARKKATHWQNVRENRASRDYKWLRAFTTKGIHSHVLVADEAMELERYLNECVKQMAMYLKEEHIAVKELRVHLEHTSDNTFNWNALRAYLESNNEK